MPNRPQRINGNQTKHEKPNRDRLLKLLSSLNKFNPKNLVNENEKPSRDELVEVALGAVADIRDFTKAYDSLHEDYAMLYMDALQAHTEMKKIGVSAPSLYEGIQKISGRHQQALDVLRSIASETLAENVASMSAIRLQNMAQKFLETIDKRNEEDSRSNIIHIGGDKIKDPGEILDAIINPDDGHSQAESPEASGPAGSGESPDVAEGGSK